MSSFGSLDYVEDALEMIDEHTEFPYLMLLAQGDNGGRFFANLGSKNAQLLRDALVDGHLVRELIEFLDETYLLPEGGYED